MIMFALVVLCAHEAAACATLSDPAEAAVLAAAGLACTSTSVSCSWVSGNCSVTAVCVVWVVLCTLSAPVSQIAGSLRIARSSLARVSLPQLTTISGALELLQTALAHVAFPRLASVGGDLVLRQEFDATLTLYAPALTRVEGSVLVAGHRAFAAWNTSALAVVGVDLTLDSNQGLHAVVFPRLTRVGGALTMRGNALPHSTAVFPALQSAGTVLVQLNIGGSCLLPALVSASELTLSGNGLLEQFDAPALQSVATLTVERNVGALAVRMESLQRIGGALSLFGNAEATNVTLPALRNAASVQVTFNVGRVVLDAPALEQVDAILYQGNAAVNTLQLGTVTVAGDVIVIENSGGFVLEAPLLRLARSVNVSGNAGIVSLHAPALVRINGSLAISFNLGVTKLSADALGHVGGLAMERNAEWRATLSLPSLATADSSVVIAKDAAVHTLLLPALQRVGTLLSVWSKETVCIRGGALLVDAQLPARHTCAYPNDASCLVCQAAPGDDVSCKIACHD